jgi:hypothetical protein
MADLDLSESPPCPESDRCAFCHEAFPLDDLVFLEFFWRGEDYSYPLCDDCFAVWLELEVDPEEGEAFFRLDYFDLPFLLNPTEALLAEEPAGPAATYATSYYRSPN